MKKAGLYIRVSTMEQANKGYSVKAQTERLEAYAKAKGYIVHDTYTDAGASGGSLERPELDRMLTDIEYKRLNAVIVIKLDRLSRSQKDTLHLIQDVFIPQKVDFISVNESFDTSTSFGIAMIGILSVFAELERSTINERLEMGRIERAKAGYYHGGGDYSPLGYDYIDGELVINEYEKEIVKEMFDLYIGGNSMNSTAMTLKEKYPDRIKSFTIVKDSLQRVLYIGKVQFNGEVYVGRHKRIIDDKTFNLAQKKRKERAVGKGWTNKRKGLLLGKLYCGQCGARYYRNVNGPRKYRYINYVCRSQDKRRSTQNMVKDANCKNRRWKEKELDDLVLGRLKKLNYQDIEKNKKKITPVNYDKLINQVEKEIKRIVQLYTQSTIDIDTLNNMSEDLQAKKSNLIEKRTNQEEKLKANDNKLIYTMSTFDWENASKDKLMHVVDTLIERIEVNGDEVNIHLDL